MHCVTLTGRGRAFKLGFNWPFQLVRIELGMQCCGEVVA